VFPWANFCNPEYLETNLGNMHVASVHPDVAAFSIFLLPCEPYIHFGHALDCRFFRLLEYGAGVEELRPYQRADSQGSLSLQGRKAGNLSEFKQMELHDIICFTYKRPIGFGDPSLLWSGNFVADHRGPGEHQDSRALHVHVMYKGPHQQGAGQLGGKGQKKRVSMEPKEICCSLNCPCVERRQLANTQEAVSTSSGSDRLEAIRRRIRLRQQSDTTLDSTGSH
jgi:hypothetical protein